MRILVFHNILFAQYKSIYFEHINEELKKKNGSLLVIQSSFSEKSRINHFNIETLEKSINYPYKVLSKKPLEEISNFTILLNWLKYIYTFKPTIVNFTGYNSWTILITLIICRLLKIKTIITNESIIKPNRTNNFIKKKLTDLIKKCILNLSDYFYTFGINANNLLFNYGVSKSQIISFGNTFQKKLWMIQERKNPINDTYKILFVGRLIEEKNLFNSIKIMAEVNKITPIQFDIYGDGPLENDLKKLVKEKHLDFISFQSAVKWENLQTIYSNYSYLLLLSNSETWGMVANEAQHYKLNVICSSNCGCANDLIINNYNGLVLNTTEEKDFPYKIASYLKSSLDSNKFIERNNLIFDESYSIKSFINNLYKIHGK